MKNFICLICLFVFSTTAFAGQVWVKGYTRKDGTYVQGHYRTTPDQYRYNNKSSQTQGGYQRDEFSSGTGATNKKNPTWYQRDNDNDGQYNPYDPYPDVKKRKVLYP